MLSSTRRAAAYSTAAQTPCAAGGDPRYLRQTCEQSLKNLGIEALDVFCMSRVDPKVPIEDSVGGMAELVKEGQETFHLALRELGRVAEAWQCRASGRRAANGVFAVLARCGGGLGRRCVGWWSRRRTDDRGSEFVAAAAVGCAILA
jgi:aryl-alcohol dehydrogenase-like predicted oxidoreductase